MKKWDSYFQKLKGTKTETWILLLLAGILLLVITLPVKKGEGAGKSDTEQGTKTESSISSGGSRTDIAAYEKQMEKRVGEILSNIDGVGKADVMITLESGGETVLQSDMSVEKSSTKETDSEGGSRLTEEENTSGQTVLYGNSGSPYVTKELCPKVTGIVICAEGGGEAYVKSEICEAMEALFDLPAHKIKVLKRMKEES